MILIYRQSIQGGVYPLPLLRHAVEYSAFLHQAIVAWCEQGGLAHSSAQARRYDYRRLAWQLVHHAHPYVHRARCNIDAADTLCTILSIRRELERFSVSDLATAAGCMTPKWRSRDEVLSRDSMTLSALTLLTVLCAGVTIPPGTCTLIQVTW